MPVEPFEFFKLVIGLIILAFPGYLWSYLFSIQLNTLERCLFGFLYGLTFFTLGTIALNMVIHIKITQTIVWLLYAVYTVPVVILYLLSINRHHLSIRRYHIKTDRFPEPKINLTCFKNKTILILIAVICFSFIIMFIPHLSHNYYLPFHVDEWIHWSYTRAVIEQGTATFIDPYLGSRTLFNPEIGFHFANACIHWISTSNIATIFLFMPAFIGVFFSFAAFVIGQRSHRQFGLEAAFLVAFIPTTVRYLGPSFYTPITLGLLFLLFSIWLAQLKKVQSIILLPVFIFCTFLIHPVAALASIGILFVYALLRLIEKEYRFALLTGIFIALPILLVYIFTSQWGNLADIFLSALSGQQYAFDLDLPKIYISFIDLGYIPWALCIIGVFVAFIKGKSLLQTLSISTIAFIAVIGLYSKFNFGFPSIYERLFLALFLLVAILAGYGLSEIRRTLTDVISKKNQSYDLKIWVLHMDKVIPVVLCLVVLLIAVPAHLNTPYYMMITEQEYETFNWIHEHIGDYRDANHSYSKAAVHPYKASPFSAVTGLHIISSTMNPVYGYNVHTQMETFLSEGCSNIAFLDKFHLSVIYGDATNTNLTKIYTNVYLYPGLSYT